MGKGSDVSIFTIETGLAARGLAMAATMPFFHKDSSVTGSCLLYTSDAADES